MGNWKDAYEAQMNLYKWARTPNGKNQMLNTINLDQLPERTRPLFFSLAKAEEGKLLGADPIFVAEEFCDLCDHAQHGFEPEPLLATDFLTPQGFVFYEKPIQIPTRDPGFDEFLAGFSWTPLMFDSDGEDWDWDPSKPKPRTDPSVFKLDENGNYEGMIAGGVALTLYAAVPEDRRWQHYNDGHSIRLPDIVPLHLTPWYFNLSFDGNEIDIHGEETSVSVWWRLCQVTLRLMQQKLAARESTKIWRPSRRRGEKLGMPPREMVVVRLRRHRNAPTGDERNVEWTHRWLVRGGWQWRAWGPGHTLRRQVFIEDYVKGPEDKPFIPKGRGFQWEE